MLAVYHYREVKARRHPQVEDETGASITLTSVQEEAAFHHSYTQLGRWHRASERALSAAAPLVNYTLFYIQIAVIPSSQVTHTIIKYYNQHDEDRRRR